VWLPKRIDGKAISDVALGFLDTLHQTYRFFALYAQDWTPRTVGGESGRSLIARWLLSRLDQLVVQVTTAWSDYDVSTGVRALVEFATTDLSNWYVRLNRGRFWAPDAEPDPAALATLYSALVVFTRLLAPAAPFLSDAIHRRLTGVSVHLSRFPQPTGDADEALNEAMEATRRLVWLARNAREAGALRIRQPLAAMRVAVPAKVRGPLFDQCLEVLSRELNVKRVKIVESDADLVKLKAKPNFRSLGKVYQSETPTAAAAAGKLTAEQLRQLERGDKVTVEDGGSTFAYRPEDITVIREVGTDWLVQSDGPYVVALDPRLTPDLKQEGVAREIVNRVQKLRKEAGYQYTTRIKLSLTGEPALLAAAQAHRDFIAGETLARRIEIGEDLADPDLRQPVDIDGHAVVVSLARLERAAAAT